MLVSYDNFRYFFSALNVSFAYFQSMPLSKKCSLFKFCQDELWQKALNNSTSSNEKKDFFQLPRNMNGYLDDEMMLYEGVN